MGEIENIIHYSQITILVSIHDWGLTTFTINFDQALSIVHSIVWIVLREITSGKVAIFINSRNYLGSIQFCFRHYFKYMACILNKDYLIRLNLDLNKLVLFNTSALYHRGFSTLFHCEFYVLCQHVGARA